MNRYIVTVGNTTFQTTSYTKALGYFDKAINGTLYQRHELESPIQLKSKGVNWSNVLVGRVNSLSLSR